MTKHTGKLNRFDIALVFSVIATCVMLALGTLPFVCQSAKAETNITAELKSGVAEVYDDISAEQIKNLLIVKDGETILKPEEYNVSVNGGKIAANATTVFVSKKESTNLKPVDFSGVTVKAATVLNRSIAAIEEYKPSGNYFVNENGYCAFVQGMTAEQVEARLAIKLEYPNHDEYKTFANDGVTWSGTAPEKTHKYGDEKDTNDTSFSISLTSTYGSANGPVVFAPSKTVGMTMPEEWTQPESSVLTPATTVETIVKEFGLQGKVKAILNSGLEGGNINVESDLNYGGQYVGATHAALNGYTAGQSFEKILEIPSNQSGVAPLKLKLNVKYSECKGIYLMITGDLPPQIARSEKLSYGDLYVTVLFLNAINRQTETKLYLRDIPEGMVQAEYFDASGKKVDKLLRTVKWIDLSYTYKEQKATKSIEGAQISPITVDAPSVKDTELTYGDNCTTEIEGLVKDSVNNDDMIISDVGAGAEKLADGKTVKFNRGGEFTITVKFVKGTNSDFYFRQGSGNGTVDGYNPTIVCYKVRVKKAPVTVSLKDFATEYEYGEGQPKYKVFGDAGGSMKFSSSTDNNVANNSNVPPATGLPVETGNDAPKFLLWYTGTLSNGGGEYKSHVFPMELGRYQAHAITAENDWYDAGELKTPHEFSIVKRKLELEKIVIPSVEYIRGRSYTINDIIGTVTVDNLLTDHKIQDVLTYVFAGSTTTAQHAGNYEIDFTIRDGNYEWKGTTEKTQNANFTIKALEYGMTVSLQGGNSFVYGEVNHNPKPVYSKIDVAISDKTTEQGTTEKVETKKSTPLDSIYAVTSAAAYYKVVGDTETLMAETDLNKFGIGTYRVKYTTSTHPDDLAADYNLPTAHEDFAITRRSLTKVSITQPTGSSYEYTGSAFEFTVDKWAEAQCRIKNNDDVLAIGASGTLFNGSAITTNITNNQDGTISVVEAGEYAFTVSITNPNYKWADEADDATSAVVGQGATYTIQQKTLELSLSETSYNYDGLAHVPSVSSPTITSLNKTFTVTGIEYYKHGAGGAKIQITAADIKPANTYYIKVIAFDIAEKIDGKYSYAVNYKLPLGELSFVIEPTVLKTPVWDSSKIAVENGKAKLTYNGTAYSVESYIANWTEYLYPSGTRKVSIAITKTGASDTALKNAGSYTVSITPLESYTWSDGSKNAAKLTVDIAQLAIEINWNENSFGGYVYNGREQTVAKGTNYTLNEMGGDVIDVTFTYSETKTTDGKAINAGDYMVTLSGITGGAAANYTIDGAVNWSHSFTIEKYALKVPEMVGSAIVDFEGSAASKSFVLQDTSGVTGFSWDNALSVSVVGKWKFGGVEYGYHLGNSTTFGFAEEKLTYTHAGEYVVTFNIKNADGNYKWADSLTGAQTRTLVVNRKKVTAPALGDQRTLEYKGNNEILYPTNLTVAGLSLTPRYGSRQEYNTVADSASSSAYGLYFVKLSIDSNWQDYEWVQNTGDNENINLLNLAPGANWGETYKSWGHAVYSASESSVYLHYMITKAILHVEYAVQSYTFGDNGYSGTYWHDVSGKTDPDVSGKTDPLSWGGADKGTIQDNNGTENLAFYKFDSSELAEGMPSNIAELKKYTDLVNGLPWDAGYYGVLVTITFPEGSQYETISNWYRFEVAKREITVNWSGSDSVIYDGKTHNLTATVTNVIYKKDGTDAEKVVVPGLTVALDASGALPVNASDTAYTLNAYIVSSTSNASNFALPASGCFATLEIDRRTVNLNVVANSAPGSVYGNALTHGNAAWAYTENCGDANKFVKDNGDAYVESNAAGYIEYKLHRKGTADTLGAEIDYTMPNAGVYWLVPALTAAAQNNYALDFAYNSASYTVEKRAITVSLNSDNAKSVYGSAVNLYQSGVYDIERTNGTGHWLVGYDNSQDVFKLTTTATGASNVGDSYPVTLTMTIAGGINYEITVNGNLVDGSATLGNWTITPADIISASVATGNTPTYDGAGHAVIGALVSASVSLVNHADNDKSVKWFYTEASRAEIDAGSAAWTEVTDLNLTDAITKKYNFMVKANNHNDKFVGECGIEIKKATLTVTINLDIRYGERNPADYSGTGVAYKATLDDLKTDNTMYTISGFMTRGGNLENIGNIGAEGTFGYSTTYNQGNNAGAYAITFINNNTLTATNYEFVNVDGVLTVNKLLLDVAITDISNVYYDTYDKVRFVTAVTLPNSTYTGVMLTADELFGNIYGDLFATSNKYQGANVFALNTGAFVDTNADTHSKRVGKYEIDITVTNDNYAVSYEKGKHTITAGSLTVGAITGYSAAYDEETHNLVYVNGGGAFATAADAQVEVKYFVADEGQGDATDTLWNGFDSAKISTDCPAAIDVCEQVIYYRLYAGENYGVVYGKVLAKIEKAANAFTTELTIAKNDWTYGLYDATTNPNGYSEPTHRVTDPTARFDRLVVDGAAGINKISAVLKIKDGIQLRETNDTLTTPSSLVADAWAHGLFNVGVYQLTVSMAETGNYGAITATIEFTVNKKELTITAISQEVTYGEEFRAGYTYDVVGYVKSKTGANVNAENADDAFGTGTSGISRDFFTTSYKIGRENGSVGDYQITTTAAATESRGNYTFNYVTAGKYLTVKPREVTIRIENHKNKYNDNDIATELQYSLVNGCSFYSGDSEQTVGTFSSNANKIINLRTLAIAGYGLKAIDLNGSSTNNVIVATRNSYGQAQTFNAYPIYAIFGADAKGSGENYNYAITFDGCSYSGSLANYNVLGIDIKIIADGDTPIQGGAGEYSIERAVLKITYNGVYHLVGGKETATTAYSGANNYYKATPDSSVSGLEMKFSYGYKTTEGSYKDISGTQIVDAGFYIAYGHLSSDNYFDTDAGFEFTIPKATITLTAKSSSVEYGTELKGDPGDNKNGRFTYGGYDYDKGTLLQGVYDAYIIAHPVTYTTKGYSVKTPVGSTCYITPKCASSDNVTVAVADGSLTVNKRNVVVTLRGYAEGNTLAQCDYLGTYEATQARLNSNYASNRGSFISVDDIGGAGDTLDKLGVTFILPNNAINAEADGYGMIVQSAGDTNYAVKFRTSEGRDAYAVASGDGDEPKFVINKAKLTIYAHLDKNGRYTVTYGNDLSYNNLNDSNSINYSVAGMQNSENFRSLINVNPTYSVLYGNKAYVAWESNVGEVYTVSVEFRGGLLDNYELDSAKGTTYITTTLSIDKRVIAVSTQNQEFEWDGQDYRDGRYGKEHKAAFTFADVRYVSDVADNNVNSAKRPQNFTVSYNTAADTSINQKKNGAPTVVGNYKVTVTLQASGNYTFSTGLAAEMSFAVTRRIIRESNLTWDPSGKISESSADKSGSFTLKNYIKSVMQVVVFRYYPSGAGTSAELPVGAAGETNKYYFDNQALKISASGFGRYEVLVKLKDSATANYVIEGNNGVLASAQFVITSTAVEMTLSIADWVYGATPNLPDVQINGNKPDGIDVAYARVGNIDNISDFYGTGAFDDITGLQLTSAGWFGSRGSLAFDAGYYAVRATYVGKVPAADGGQTDVTVTRYHVFRVETAKIAVPVMASGTYTFNGGEQSLAIAYNTRLVRSSYNGYAGTSEDGIVVYATGAKTYTIRFTLVDTANYEWAGGGTGTCTLDWVIGRDTSENGQVGDAVLGANAQTGKVYGEELSAVGGETVKSGYYGLVKRSYVDAVGRNFANASEIAAAEWTDGLPQNAGDYFVRLLLVGNEDFTDKVTYVRFNVRPREIAVTASGSVTYGNDWRAGVGYVGDGLYGDRVVGTATYRLADNYSTLNAGGEYYVIVNHDANGVALALTVNDVNGNDVSRNYVVKSARGKLVVNKRMITVTLGAASSQFGKNINLDNVGVSYGAGQLVEGDDLGIELTTTATIASSVGGYVIDARYNNDNYEVTTVQGAYTITQRKVEIRIDSVASATYGSVPEKPVDYSVLDGDVDITEFVTANGFVLTIMYTGMANDGEQIVDSVAVPTKAGDYTVKVLGSGSANFIVVGEPFAAFVVGKKEFDASMITVANQTYTGETLTPVIADGEFVKLYGDVYEALEHDAFVGAGTHTITLRVKDFDNCKWKFVEVATQNITFTIDKADNAITSDIAISGWIYGEYSVDANLPSAAVKFGQQYITFVYSSAIDGTYTSGAPVGGDVGKYWVKASVPAADNYNAFVSAPVEFAISKKALAKPAIVMVTDGENKNDVYTGVELAAALAGFDMTRMNLDYAGKFNVNAGQIVVVAQNAGTYTVKLSIINAKNFCWLGENAEDDVVLVWTIAPKPIAKPTSNTGTFIVNGSVLTYMPVGFDASIMSIAGNKTAYGGEFPVTIGLTDKSNYVWADGGTDDFVLAWKVVGINTVFVIVASVLGGASGLCLLAVALQFSMYVHRRRVNERDIDRRSRAEEVAPEDNGKKTAAEENK